MVACKPDPHKWQDVTLLDETVTIPEGRYKVWPYSQAEQGLVKVEYTLVTGPSVDVGFYGEDQANDYEAMLKGDKECGPVRKNPDLSFSPLARSHTSSWVDLMPGRYCVIADNADCGETKTQTSWFGVGKSATVHMKLVGKKRPVSKWPW